jgi:anion-transporting  ArsA/GET3 family ATPase
MEVHHPHHPTHKKKWSEYILEFAMLFLAVSMGFVAENLREKYVEKERSEELIQAFIIDVKANQKQLDSLIIQNQKFSNYFDSLSVNHAVINHSINLLDLSKTLNFWMYRFMNRKTIFEQMKSSGALRYIQNKDKLKAILQYEEHANLAESRSMETETQQYFDQFRPSLEKLLPPSFYIIRETDSFNVNNTNLEIYPGLLKNYHLHQLELNKQLQDTKLSINQIRELSKIWFHRNERLQTSLISQLGLRVEGKHLIALLEEKN